MTDTSIAALKRATTFSAESRRRVWEWIQGCGLHGATDEEVQIALAMNPSTERPRRGELVKAGHVCDSGWRRETRSGTKAIVWISRILKDT